VSFVVLKLRRCSGRTYASDLRRGLESTPKTKKPILQGETQEQQLSQDSDLETFADFETSQPSPFDKLHDGIIIIIAKIQARNEVKQNAR
jgi:hypothetical protein